ncbi:hypothetical protein EIN_254570 [Entamoeba invadens IP1]|uniref:Uncharacterized protein n=1 Tax=Entamoeba invadens IP1 TaxID=370355 RepID=A0A0A1UF42_ENTIV|nr:hypothetical protein EIN_254570 [Entamoeba invadens IP1]ELP95103.1 hypothetical protein EIN_254570 [Entamoeba invadens IP1]|eukprot:XP_004261874.1 hypothetical protein EIN_254570 [Entamoeba invadens IP1]
MKHKMKRLIVEILIGILNVLYLIVLIVIDIVMITTKLSVYLHVSYSIRCIGYTFIVILLLYSSVGVFKVNIRQLEQYHPKPFTMGLVGLIVCVSLSTRIVYDFTSAILGESLLSLLCSTPSDFCRDNMGVAFFISEVIETILMNLWEIFPLIAFVVLFWKLPKQNRNITPFPNIDELSYYDDDGSGSILYDVKTPLVPK